MMFLAYVHYSSNTLLGYVIVLVFFVSFVRANSRNTWDIRPVLFHYTVSSQQQL